MISFVELGRSFNSKRLADLEEVAYLKKQQVALLTDLRHTQEMVAEFQTGFGQKGFVPGPKTLPENHPAIEGLKEKYAKRQKQYRAVSDRMLQLKIKEKALV